MTCPKRTSICQKETQNSSCATVRVTALMIYIISVISSPYYYYYYHYNYSKTVITARRGQGEPGSVVELLVVFQSDDTVDILRDITQELGIVGPGISIIIIIIMTIRNTRQGRNDRVRVGQSKRI